MHLTFKQIKNTEDPKIFSKPNLSSNFKPKFFMVLGLILMLLFGIYWFMAKPDKAEKQRADLNYLKTKVKNGEELDANQRSSFCELLWLVEKTAVADCEKLTLGQMQTLIKYKTSAKSNIKGTELSKRLGTDYHEFKDSYLKPMFKILNFQKQARIVIKKIDNPDAGYWGENKEYLFFIPSATRKNNEEQFSDYKFYTFELFDSLKNK